MLYSNINLKTTTKQMDFGSLDLIEAGEEGRGRKILSLPVPQGVSEVKKGMNSDLSIGFTKSLRPRIVKKNDSTIYLLLSSEGGYTRRGNGAISHLNSQEEVKILARGNGADGDAGKIGSWDVILLETPLTNVVIKVKIAGGNPSKLYFIHEGNVYETNLEHAGNCCDKLDIEMPFSIIEDKFNLEEWKIL